MACEDCKSREIDRDFTKAFFLIFVLAVVVNLVIADIDKLRKTVVRVQDSLSLAHEKIYEFEKDSYNRKVEEVKTDG